MLFMMISTWEPENQNEVIRRRLATGSLASEKYRVLGKWSVFGGGKIFTVFDVDNQLDAYEAILAYGDICKIEILPVVTMKELGEWGEELIERA